MKNTIQSISRRKFIKSTSLAALSFNIIPSRFFGANAPSNKLNIACIGIGGMGAANLHESESENIVALCDVDSDHAAEVFNRYPKAKRYQP